MIKQSKHWCPEYRKHSLLSKISNTPGWWGGSAAKKHSLCKPDGLNLIPQTHGRRNWLLQVVL